MRYWSVAGGVLENERGLLLVANRRRDGRVDWSTPGGVVDAGESPLEALRREICEETGLLVETFVGPLWTVVVDFADLDMRLAVEIHRGAAWTGEIEVADPDGIVTEVEFVSAPAAAELLSTSPQWVAEPLESWLARPWTDTRLFEYRATGTDPARMRSERVS